MGEDLSDKLSGELLEAKSRKKLLPWWVKVFSWIFLVLGALAPVALLAGILGFNFEVSLYGYETNQPVSLVGIAITTFYCFKGLTAYCLLKQKDWAIKYAIVDATLGILACTLSMFFPLVNSYDKTPFTFRLELLLLIPYLILMAKIKSEWELTRTHV